eukprot:TRINITY_DN26382_c0_g1_i1.p1 TRINITY_DN26382_c0_g1~~TRINITY_DN26382_c0_g1_i1.p1  ORF type:complete len:193 (+),score=39.32 TRINITY_DN26382_c0_g1_i1:115-693(+)
MMGEAPDADLASNPAMAKIVKLQQLTQHYLDKTVVWFRTRWFALLGLTILYILRVYLVQGFFVVTYGLGIYVLNLFINFLSPAVDPETEEGPTLPTTNGEFRPFTRKLPEFKFWMCTIRAVCIAMFLTFFSFFDLPVFWPILLAYFILLFVLTMKDRVKHMIKHKYIPFSMGKQTYGDLTKVKAGGDSKDSK